MPAVHELDHVMGAIDGEHDTAMRPSSQRGARQREHGDSGGQSTFHVPLNDHERPHLNRARADCTDV
jgi:hypothetical protein